MTLLLLVVVGGASTLGQGDLFQAHICQPIQLQALLLGWNDAGSRLGNEFDATFDPAKLS